MPQHLAQPVLAGRLGTARDRGLLPALWLFGMPLAYWMAVKAPPARRGLLLALVLVPFWTNFLVRTIGWQVILAPQGWLSSLMQRFARPRSMPPTRCSN